jgi:hypothetical protein
MIKNCLIESGPPCISRLILGLLMDNELGKDLKGNDRELVRVLSQRLSGGTEENHGSQVVRITGDTAHIRT